jgi:hypothetical protein
MGVEAVPSVGGKDLKDFEGLSRAPELGFWRKQSLPPAPRGANAASAPSAFQQLKTFVSDNVIGWISEYLRYRIGRKHPFPSYDDPKTDSGVYPLYGDQEQSDDVVRVAIAGDWGTGTDEAYTVAKLMRERAPHYTVHLGDVYFVGDPTEVNENFLGLANPEHNYTPCRWPEGSRAAFALNGNHEMYARGFGYFDHILPAMGTRSGKALKQQKASFFCLENAHWRVIALDTGYNSIGLPLIEQIIQPDCALPEPLLAWLRDVVRQKDDRRGIVLLSHHQYASRFDTLYPKPAEQLAEFVDRPVLWLWGHEHRLAIYEKYQAGSGIAAYGRCIGHGGMPVALPPDMPLHEECVAEFVDYREYPNNEGLQVGINGFAALTFERETLKIEYVDVADTVIFSETWKTDSAGGLERVASWALKEAQTPGEGGG